MTLDISIEAAKLEREQYDTAHQRSSLTILLIKAVGIALRKFSVLYSYFDGRKIIRSEHIKINLPVSENNHVEYVVIERPDEGCKTFTARFAI
jgi:pyruvate/2-oxoglutarate dehydrogenase complex dihydrolipoamide acyltransferase (E2) component